MNKKIKDRLIKASREYDKVCEREDRVKIAKDKARDRLLKAVNAAIADVYSDIESPEETAFTWVDEETGLAYRKVIAQSPRFETEVFMQDHPDLAQELIVENIEYDFDDKAYRKLLRERPELAQVMSEYTIEGKPSSRLYRGTEVTAEDL